MNRQKAINMYDEVLKGYLRNFYATHCTDSDRVIKAANKAFNDEYDELMKEFKEALE